MKRTGVARATGSTCTIASKYGSGTIDLEANCERQRMFWNQLKNATSFSKDGKNNVPLKFLHCLCGAIFIHKQSEYEV